MLYLIAAFCLAFMVTLTVIPPVLKIAHKKRLFDMPVARSSHSQATPSLGGVGIFAGFLTALLFFIPVEYFEGVQYILGGFLLIFLIGVKDDLDPMKAWRKLIAQIILAIILITLADVRLESMHGIFGWSGDMPYALSVALSTITIILIINAFNLVDGINGLSASLGILIMAIFGAWMFMIGETAYSLFAAAGIGAYLAFIRFNLMPKAHTFMGDSGSLLLGTIASVLALEFIEFNSMLSENHFLHMPAAPVVAMSILSIPLFDTLRVFATRVMRGRHPMQPDRRHLHHLMIDYGYSHTQATGVLVAFNLLLFNVALVGQYYLDQHVLLFLVMITGLIPLYYLHKSVHESNNAEIDEEDKIQSEETPARWVEWDEREKTKKDALLETQGEHKTA